MTKERLFKKAYAKELLAVAKADLETARILAASGLKRQENTFFNLQQGVEKSLKALLCWREKPVPLVHDLAIILDRFDTNDPVVHADDISDWTQFATIRRYEEGIIEFTAAEIARGLQVAEELIGWVEARLR